MAIFNNSPTIIIGTVLFRYSWSFYQSSSKLDPYSNSWRSANYRLRLCFSKKGSLSTIFHLWAILQPELWIIITNPFALRLVSTLCFKDLSLIRRGLRTVRHSFVLPIRKSLGAENRILLRRVSSVRVFPSTFRMKVQSWRWFFWWKAYCSA